MGMDFCWSGSANYGRFLKEMGEIAKVFGAQVCKTTELVVGFYKQMVMTWYKGEQKVHWLRWDYAGKYSIYIEVGGTKLHFKALSENKDVYYGRFYYKGDLYEVVFGYGIDPTQSTWNRVKKTYCDKKTIKFVDKFWGEN